MRKQRRRVSLTLDKPTKTSREYFSPFEQTLLRFVSVIIIVDPFSILAFLFNFFPSDQARIDKQIHVWEYMKSELFSLSRTALLDATTQFTARKPPSRLINAISPVAVFSSQEIRQANITSGSDADKEEKRESFSESWSPDASKQACSFCRKIRPRDVFEDSSSSSLSPVAHPPTISFDYSVSTLTRTFRIGKKKKTKLFLRAHRCANESRAHRL